MTTSDDFDAIIRALAASGCQAPAVHRGLIRAESRGSVGREEAIRAFRGMAGQGWLCQSNQRHIIRFDVPEDLPPLVEDGWPECGEVANGNRSLHLAADGCGAWTLTCLSYEPDGDGLIVEHRLQAITGQAMVYQVGWQETTNPATKLAEHRPALCRFVRFEPLSTENPR
jgi:hypothetical protein